MGVSAMNTRNDKLTVGELFQRLKSRGTGAYGLSDVSQLEHALQTAALANQRGLGDKMIIAALFHDIGHMFDDKDVDLAHIGIDDKHEIASANILQELYSADISEPVRLHVPAKRYLCTVDPEYFEKLSHDSRRSLDLQGGLMSDDELRSFETNTHHKDAVILRRLDDEAKVPGLDVPAIESYVETAQALCCEGRGSLSS